MGQLDIPKYVKILLPRLKPTINEQLEGIVGYTWRLYGCRKVGGIQTLQNEAQKLVAFAKRFYAESFIVKEHMYYKDIDMDYPNIGTKWHRQKAYRMGFHNYVTLVITDPVAQQLEKAKTLHNISTTNNNNLRLECKTSIIKI